MEKRDWLLLFIRESVEPIQIQKGMFKFSKESGTNEIYSFVPYNWGPCSVEIYDDLKQLREEGLIEFIPSNRGWNTYRLTEEGQNKSESLRKSSDSKILSELDRIHQYVVSRDFEKLLSDVYKDYPQYAEKSLFKGLDKVIEVSYVFLFA